MSKQLVAALLLIAFVAAPVGADTISYPDSESSQFFFTNLTETSLNDTLPLFGDPIVNGNNLEFGEPGFLAFASGGPFEFIDGRLTVTVTSKDGDSITGFELLETGTYEGTGVDLDIFVSGIGFATADGEIYQDDFQFTRNTAGSGIWNGAINIEFDNPVDSFSFVVDNQLFVRGGSESAATVNKDNIRLTVNTTTAIPEASTAVLIFGAAFAGGFIRRR